MFSINWWFQLIPLWSPFALRVFFIVFLGIVIIGAVVRMVSRQRLTDKYALEIANRSANLLVVTGVLGLWDWFVSGQQVPLLSARFWLVVLLALVIWWVWAITRYARKTVPEMRNRHNERKEQMKYFTKKRKK